MQIKSLKNTAIALGAVAIASFASPALAQTENILISATLSNEVGLNVDRQLHFGVIGMVSDTGETASVAVSTTGTGAASASTTGGTAGAAVVDDTLVSNAMIEVTGGANGVDINVEIDNVVDPANSGDEMVLDDFVISWNDGVDNAFVIGVAEAVTFDTAFGGGTNTLVIGASVTTADPELSPAAYSSVTYSGSYDVIFSY